VPSVTSFQTLKGMRDVLAPESTRRRALVQLFADVVERAGYREVVPPLVEDLGVFLRVGEATDVVTKEMYDFTDKDGSRIALRPEMTAGVVRAFVQHRPVLPWKVWYSGSNFRHERPQKGRYRMFDQVGVEVITLASRFFDAVGLRDVTLSVNSLGDHADRERYTEAVRAYLEAHKADLSDAAVDTLARNPLRVLDSKRPSDREIVDGAPLVAEFLSEESAAHYRRVLEGLEAVGVEHVEAPRLVRGLDYYRRTTFEFAADSLDAAQNAIGGGGRYDGLAEDLGGPPTDGIGFALGVDRILLACDAEATFAAPPGRLDVFVVDLVTGEAAGRAARDVTHELRDAGIAAERRFGGGSLKSQMKSADRSDARYAVIIGDDEDAASEVTLRPLRVAPGGERAPQRRIRRSELLAELRDAPDGATGDADAPRDADRAP
jgi:histidyl-tRNA synthetase